MLKNKTPSFIIFIILLTSISYLTSAQVTDFCNGIAEDIVYNQEIEASISDSSLFGRYCFSGRAGDIINIQITRLEGDLVFSGALSDHSVDEIFAEFTSTPDNGTINITFTLPQEDSYHLLISREDFGRGTTSGSYFLSVSSGNEPLPVSEDVSIFPEILETYSGNWSDVVEELELADLISPDGELIFNLEIAFFDGQGSFFTPISRNSLYRDVVVSAELNFTSDSDLLETCSLLAHVTGEETAETFLEIGIDNQGNIFWIDASQTPMSSGSEASALDLSQVQHLLFIVQSENLSIYLNGQLLRDSIEVSARSGSFGIALMGKGRESRCEATNMWGYSAPVMIEGLCEATTAVNVNRRAGASTGFAITGIIKAGRYVRLIAQTIDGAGLSWYQLDDEGFVREDVVVLSGDCDNLPLSE